MDKINVVENYWLLLREFTRECRICLCIDKTWDILNLPQFDGHFEKEYTINLKGVSNEKEAGIFTGV